MAETQVAPTQTLINVFLGQINGVPAHVCDARDLHAYLKNGDLFANWIKARIEQGGFAENQDFALVLENAKIKKGRGGDRRSKDYHLTLSMGKHLGMMERNDQGKAIRDYFIEKEREAIEASGQIVPANHLETLIPSEQQTLSEIVHQKAAPYGENIGKALAEIWSRLHHKFRVAKYSQLARTQLADAIVYVTSMVLRGVAAPAEPEHLTLSAAQRHQLTQAVHRSVAGFDNNGGDMWAWNRLRVKLNLRSANDIRPDQLPLALAELADIAENLMAFFHFRAELREFVEREVIGAGTPWTNNVSRKWKAQMQTTIPPRPDWLLMRQKLSIAA
jgi:phage anti-repressor protein